MLRGGGGVWGYKKGFIEGKAKRGEEAPGGGRERFWSGLCGCMKPAFECRKQVFCMLLQIRRIRHTWLILISATLPVNTNITARKEHSVLLSQGLSANKPGHAQPYTKSDKQLGVHSMQEASVPVSNIM